MDNDLYAWRNFDPERDYPLACEWWRKHGRDPYPLNLLPATGIVICRPSSARLMVWLYFDTTSPTAFVDHVLSAPGQENESVRSAWIFACKSPIPVLAEERGVEVIIGRCPPALARQCKPLGWTIDDTPLISIACVL
jgi:hypothetical protein